MRLALVPDWHWYLPDQRAESQDIASKIRYVELAGAPDFIHTFIQSSYLGRFRIVNGKRKEIE